VAVFPSSVISLLLHTRHFNTALIRRTSGRSLETFKQSSTISYVGERLTEGYFHFVLFRRFRKISRG
jgi:hypothetical protein